MPWGTGQGKHIGGTNTELHTEIEKSTLQKNSQQHPYSKILARCGTLTQVAASAERAHQSQKVRPGLSHRVNHQLTLMLR